MSKTKPEAKDDGLTACKLLSGKFHQGRNESRKTFRAGDIVRVTKRQLKSFRDLLGEVKPEVLDAERADPEAAPAQK